MDLDNIQRKYGLPAPLPVVQDGKFATRFPLNLEHRGDDVFQFGGKYIGEIENIYDLLYKILTNQEIDASLALPYAIKITEDKLYIRDKTNSEWITIFDITKPNFPKEIELYELIYKAITHQVIGEDTSYPGQFKIEENILYVRDKDNLIWTQIGNVTKEFLGATEATQAILDQVNEILTEVQELKTELNRQIATTNETLTTALQAANEAMTSAQSINIRTFNNVEEMKASNTLKAGALAKTQGFYQSSDGGGASYIVVDDIGEDEADEAGVITLQNGLYAKLLIKDYINVKQMGAYGDNVNDDATLLQKILQTYKTRTIYFPRGIYLVSESLKTYKKMSEGVNLLLDNRAVIKAIAPMDYVIEIGGVGDVDTDNNDRYENPYDTKRFFIGGTIDANYQENTSCIGLNGYISGFTCRDVKAVNFTKYGINTKSQNDFQAEGIFSNLYFGANTKRSEITYGEQLPICIYARGNDNQWSDIVTSGGSMGILDEGSNMYNRVHLFFMPPDDWEGVVGVTMLNSFSSFYTLYIDTAKTNVVVGTNCRAYIRDFKSYSYMGAPETSDDKGMTIFALTQNAKLDIEDSNISTAPNTWTKLLTANLDANLLSCKINSYLTTSPTALNMPNYTLYDDLYYSLGILENNPSSWRVGSNSESVTYPFLKILPLQGAQSIIIPLYLKDVSGCILDVDLLVKVITNSKTDSYVEFYVKSDNAKLSGMKDKSRFYLYAYRNADSSITLYIKLYKPLTYTVQTIQAGLDSKNVSNTVIVLPLMPNKHADDIEGIKINELVEE